MTETMLREKSRIMGAKIKYYRTVKGLKQVPFAEQLGISYQYLSRVECGKQTPAFALLLAIAEALEVDVACLVSDAR